MGAEIHIINNSHTEILKERNPNERWDGEETRTDNAIVGFEVIGPDNKWKCIDISTTFDIDPNKTYYLVSVIYSTGDSFNHHEGKIDYIEMYETAEQAMETKKTIEEKYNKKDKEDRYGVDIKNNAGTSYRISASWVGYFERLEEVRIDRVQQKL